MPIPKTKDGSSFSEFYATLSTASKELSAAMSLVYEEANAAKYATGNKPPKRSQKRTGALKKMRRCRSLIKSALNTYERRQVDI